MGNGNGLGIASLAIGAAQGLGNLISGARTNKNNRKWQEKMYERQKADNIEFWKMENMYNSPVMQMQRLKDAGLNPNLVYGNGADAQGGQINSPSQNTEDQRPPQMPDPSFMLDIYNMRKMDAQTDLARQEIQVKEKTAELQAAQTLVQGLVAQHQAATNEVQRATIQTQIDLANQQLKNLISTNELTQQQTRTSAAVEDNTRVSTTNTIDRLFMEWQRNDISLKTLGQQYLNEVTKGEQMKTQMGLTRSQTDLTDVQKDLAVLEYVMTRSGVNKNDTVIQRGIKNFLSLVTRNKAAAKAEMDKLKKYIESH